MIDSVGREGTGRKGHTEFPPPNPSVANICSPNNGKANPNSDLKSWKSLRLKNQKKPKEKGAYCSPGRSTCCISKKIDQIQLDWKAAIQKINKLEDLLLARSINAQSCHQALWLEN